MKTIKDNREFNWSMAVILLLTILIWYSIFKFGFFTTVAWIVVISAIVGICIRLKEETRL
tara:strand:- start:164 stop:343 length:180 start_codon:yes stop_codon:yes gene_type:complete